MMIICGLIIDHCWNDVFWTAWTVYICLALFSFCYLFFNLPGEHLSFLWSDIFETINIAPVGWRKIRVLNALIRNITKNRTTRSLRYFIRHTLAVVRTSNVHSLNVYPLYRKYLCGYNNIIMSCCRRTERWRILLRSRISRRSSAAL